MAQPGSRHSSGGYVPAPPPGGTASTPMHSYHPQHALSHQQSQHHHHPPPQMYEQHQVRQDPHQAKQEYPSHPYHRQQPSYDQHHPHPSHAPPRAPSPSSIAYHQLPPPPSSHHAIPPSLHHQQQHQSYQQPQPPLLHALPTQHVPLANPLRSEDPTQPLVVDEQNLIPVSKVEEESGRRYALDVVQQPKRARMCGFGDKDRRPITPPPCVRLIITDARTGKEIDYSTLEYNTFVLNVDLWNESATKEVNLVRSSQDPGPGPYGQIVTSTPGREASYPPPSGGYPQEFAPSAPYAQTPPAYPPNGTYGPPTQYFPSHAAGIPAPGTPQYGPSSMAPPGYGPEQGTLTRLTVASGQPHGMFTRNLIGSTAAGAFRLNDTKDNQGIWFVLQDLSVRTEGSFRLKFSFFDVGQRGYNPPRTENEPKINTSRAPVLATAFTEALMVYSAKKFPGVCESTSLSKTFATQGIKIPIRKDVKGGDGNEDDDD